MISWQEEQLDVLLKATSHVDLIEHLAAITRKLGFDFCAYGVQMPIPISRPNTILINNYPPEWQGRYAEQEYLEIDPIVRHGLNSSQALVWTPRLFVAAPNFWDEARSAGITTGWSQASRDRRGAVGMLSVSRGSEAISLLELRDKGGQLSWLCNFAHTAMARFLLPLTVPESQASLTHREREVIRWTAEGKTAYEIGQILAVSERTVNFHINNVVAKFGASNKTQAAVKAAVLGMLG